MRELKEESSGLPQPETSVKRQGPTESGVLKASDLAGKSVVSEGLMTGYRTVCPLVDGSRVAVSYLEVVRENGSSAERRWLSYDSLDQVEKDVIRVSAKNKEELFLRDQAGLPPFVGQVNLIGMKVISRMGDLLGEMDDYLFSRRSGLLLVILIRTGEDQLMIRWDDQFSIVGDIVISDMNKRLEPGEYERLTGEAAREPLAREADTAPETESPSRAGRSVLATQTERQEKGRQDREIKKAEKKEKVKKAQGPDRSMRTVGSGRSEKAEQREKEKSKKAGFGRPMGAPASLKKERPERPIAHKEDESETGPSGSGAETLLLSGSDRNLLKRYIDE